MIRGTARLHDNELFRALTDEELSPIEPLCSDFVAIEDSIIFTEGSTASYLYLVAEGKVALQKALRVPHAKHSRRTTISVCSSGEVVGWSALVEPYKYTLSAMAWESSRLIRIEARTLRRALDSYPETGYKVMKALAAVTSLRLQQMTEALIAEREVSYSGLKLGVPVGSGAALR